MNTTPAETIQPIAHPAIAGAGSKRWVLTGFKVLVSAFLIYYLVRQTELGKISAALASANLGLIALSFLLHGIGYFSSSYRWRILLRAQGFEVPVGYLVRSYAIAMFFNNLLPSTIGGDGYRAYDTSKRGIPKLRALAIVVVERFLGLFALLFFAIVALAVATELTTQIENLWVWSLLTLVFMAGIVWFIFFKGDGSLLPATVWRLPGMSLVKKQTAKMLDAFKPFQGKTTALAGAMVLSLLLQLNVIVHYYLISEALDLGIPLVKYLVIIPLSMFIQMVPISINGIGLRESFYVFFLTTIYGAPIAAALAFSWIAYGMILLLGILGGVIYAFRK